MSPPDTANTTSNALLERQADWLKQYTFDLRVTEEGTALSVGDGIAWVKGLPSAGINDVLLFDDGSRGMVFDLNPDVIGAVLLHATDDLTAGTHVRLARQPLSVPVGEALLGRVIDPVGTPLDAKPAPETSARQRLHGPSPQIVERDFVHEPLYTGTKIIDTLIPLGKGQRQLLISDEGLGRSSLALDAVIHQRGLDVHCVYVLIGQKRSSVVNTIETLKRFNAMEYTTVVVAEANALPGLQHLAPFAGCAIAEHWMRLGKHVLVVYDDLSTHARTYRGLSLLLRRPPGREAYPGDIFSLHAGLLERSTCLSAQLGGGSMTALPIVETQQGEIAAYIPTNLISITDGQIYLDGTLFAGGFRPAIDIAVSVSRIGGKAQHPAIKREAGRMKLDYLQFLELEVFTRFGAHLEESMEKSIQRGRQLRELLKQDRLAPLPIEFDMAWVIAFNEHLLDDLPSDKLKETLAEFEVRVGDSGLTLDKKRNEWVRALKQWISALEKQQEPNQNGEQKVQRKEVEGNNGTKRDEKPDEPPARP